MSSDPPCQATEGAVAAFVAGRLSARETSRVRRHRAACPACDALWRGQVAAAASLQSRRRREREAGERERRRTKHRRLALEAAAFDTGVRGGRRQRGWRLRLLLLPAFAMVLMAVIHPLGRARRASLSILAGEVQLTANRYGTEDPPVPLVRGDQCSTGSRARARVVGAEGSVELDQETFLVVEDEMGLRLRLESGAVAVEGSAEITSRFGVVEVEKGRALLRTLADGLELQAERGRVIATNGEGARQVLPGTTAVLGHPR